ncbi:MAG: P-II family nitrogen regulator [Methanosarcina sp.]
MHNDNFVLIVTIVKKGWGDEVIKASKKAGAQGGTILFGRGTGIHENKSILGLRIEPEKEIVLTIAESSIENDIRNSIIKAIDLNEPGTGIGFVISLDRVFGICHSSYETECSKKEN